MDVCQQSLYDSVLSSRTGLAYRRFKDYFSVLPQSCGGGKLLEPKSLWSWNYNLGTHVSVVLATAKPRDLLKLIATKSNDLGWIAPLNCIEISHQSSYHVVLGIVVNTFANTFKSNRRVLGCLCNAPLVARLAHGPSIRI